MPKRQVFYRDIMPNFRIHDDMVEIPHEFDHLFGPLIAEDLERAKKVAVPILKQLIRAHKSVLILDESSENRQPTVWGTKIPVDVWRRIVDKPVPGWRF